MFTLFKEALFYKCYNEDAMVFVQKVRVYKPTKSFDYPFRVTSPN